MSFVFTTTTSLAALFLHKQTILYPLPSVTFVKTQTETRLRCRRERIQKDCQLPWLFLIRSRFLWLKLYRRWNCLFKMTVAIIAVFPYCGYNQMVACKLTATPSFPLCFHASRQRCKLPVSPLISSSLQVKLSMSPPLLLLLLLFLRSQEKWIILALSPQCSCINSALPSPWSVPAASCYLTAWSAAKLIPHHNRSQLQVICHRRDSNPIMCTQKTLNHAQAHTDVHEVCMHRC